MNTVKVWLKFVAKVLSGGVVISLIFVGVALACANPTDSFATEVLLNKPGISYDLSDIAQAEGVTFQMGEVSPSEVETIETVIKEVPKPQEAVTGKEGVQPEEGETQMEIEAIIYRSHYDPQVAVILSESGVGPEAREHLSARVQIPTREVHGTTPLVQMRLVGQMDIASLDVEQAQTLGWETFVYGTGSWTVGGSEVEGDDDDEENEGHSEGRQVSRNIYTLRKDNLLVHIMPAGRRSLTETEVEVTVNDAASLSDEVRSEIARVLVAIGFAADEQVALQNASVESKVNEWMDLAEAVDVSADEFDWQEAMRTELAWLRDKGVIVGLSDAEIEEIAAACERGTAGYNSRIVYEAGKWLPYRETSQPQLLKGELTGGSCRGFSLDVLPEETVENVPRVARDIRFSIAFSESLIIVSVIGGVVVLGAGVLVWYRRGRQ
ncbi:MAG: hypothetical protein U9Q78_04930 [Chloroflexota bacterium]|nr:hypothetical protein [Chloroflexota bacterium]